MYRQATTNLGLLNRSYPTDDEYDPKGAKTQWQRFEYYLDHLTKTCGETEQYKLLYMGRHGEGYHNVAEAFYGTPAWDVRQLVQIVLKCGREADNRIVLLVGTRR
jgi:hypothetical protein